MYEFENNKNPNPPDDSVINKQAELIKEYYCGLSIYNDLVHRPLIPRLKTKTTYNSDETIQQIQFFNYGTLTHTDEFNNNKKRKTTWYVCK
ncbi:hypothetical protein [Candidatus Phytoplasma ziziphi]|nr:hypothetical protein [Candidatus Phytoplasma ziziphi]